MRLLNCASVEANQSFNLYSLCSEAYFTTISANKGRQEWMDCIEKSTGKYNLYCHASESQIQEYLMGKYESFLNDANPQEFPVKIAANTVGLQQVEDTTTANEIGMDTTTQVWVLNESTQVTLCVCVCG